MAEQQSSHTLTDVSKVVEGTCKWFGSSYGFFTVPGAPADVFVHVSSLPREGEKFVRPEDGGRVRFRWGKRSDDPSRLQAAPGVEVIDRRKPKANAA